MAQKLVLSLLLPTLRVELILNYYDIVKNVKSDNLLTLAALHAEGDIIAPWIADDDFIFPESLSLVAELFRDTNVTSVAGPYVKYDVGKLSVLSDSIPVLNKRRGSSSVKIYEAGEKLADAYCANWELEQK